jgi:DNA-binding CsgD family transcriptional regulator/tetratricopeptide (TPR) repeat protein
MPQLSRFDKLPFVGRTAELTELRGALDGVDSRSTSRSARLISGPSGIGKSRLAAAAADEAVRRGWLVASGRAFRVETGVPYALFADALLPFVRRMDEQELPLLTRGVGELTQIFPWLGASTDTPLAKPAADFRSRLHWHFTQFLRSLAAKQPLLLILEDLQWADTSSLELLHFVVRHSADAPVVLLGTINSDHTSRSSELSAFLQDMRSLSAGGQLSLDPLAPGDVEELVCHAFEADSRVVRAFARQLYDWTRGNPFFVGETLKLLVSAGDLRLEDGRWTGWQVDALQLPQSVRDVVMNRLDSLSPEARDAADLAAAIGARLRLPTLLAVSGAEPDAVLKALEELCRQRILMEDDQADDVTYDFVHPLVRETLYSEFGRARLRVLHASIGEALERHYGDGALEHADELAYHFGRGLTDGAERAVRYMAEAGRRALAKYANREAADYLAAALARTDHVDRAAFCALAEGLARARQRLGEYGEALALWERLHQIALEGGEVLRAAAASRRMGLACYWRGELSCALRHFDAGVAEAGASAQEDRQLLVELLTARAACLQELGRPVEALEAATSALDIAHDAPAATQARVHRTLLLLHLWTGDAELARRHGARALELARASGDRPLAFIAHWSMGVLEAFSGDADGVERNLTACRMLADELGAPVLHVWAAELAVEFASARGEWDVALQLGEEAIQMARALQQRTLLPRLLVWTALIHLGRGAIERGSAYVEEAWRLSRPDDGDGSGTTRNSHAVLASYIGRTAVHLAKGEHEEAVRTGEEGVAYADRLGYVLWAVHRLLPMVAEACLWQRDLERARRTGERLRRDAEGLGHRLGIGWANACDACVVWLGGDSRTGAVLMRRAAEELEAIPFLPDATRLRRQLAGRLADIGEREAALAELRTVHERLLQLGAEHELNKARQQFRELGARPPARSAGERGTTAPVTDRELLVAGLVARRKSSKAIARELDISVRTVDTHLSNIYRKLEIGSRAELADLYRAGALDGTLSENLN